MESKELLDNVNDVSFEVAGPAAAGAFLLGCLVCIDILGNLSPREQLLDRFCLDEDVHESSLIEMPALL